MSKIPEFQNDEEERDFWDTHSIVDFEDELEEVNIEVVKALRHVFIVDMDNLEKFFRPCKSLRKGGP